jgi:hypothetical protein
MVQPAREKNERGRNETNHSDAADKSCGKPPRSLAATLVEFCPRSKAVEMRGSLGYPQSRATAAGPILAATQASPEAKDPSGGTTGRVKPYGARVGWVLAPNMASMGRNSRSHRYSVLRGRLGVQSAYGFFWIPELLRIYCAAAPSAPATAGFSEATAGRFATGTAAAAAATAA